MRRLLNATSTQVNTYKHQGSHIWRSRPLKSMKKTQMSESEAVRTQDQTQTREQDVQTEVRQTEDEPDTSKQRAPIFASFAGMDLLGMGLRKTFEAGKCIGGSEWNNSARLLFRREHGFDPFEDHEDVPDYAYKHVFMVTTGAPCVAFSRAGSQKVNLTREGSIM